MVTAFQLRVWVEASGLVSQISFPTPLLQREREGPFPISATHSASKKGFASSHTSPSALAIRAFSPYVVQGFSFPRDGGGWCHRCPWGRFGSLISRHTSAVLRSACLEQAEPGHR